MSSDQMIGGDRMIGLFVELSGLCSSILSWECWDDTTTLWRRGTGV